MIDHVSFRSYKAMPETLRHSRSKFFQDSPKIVRITPEMTGKPEVAHLVTLYPTARRAGSTGGTARGAVDYDAFAVLAGDGRIIGLEFELACTVRLLVGGSIGVVQHRQKWTISSRFLLEPMSDLSVSWTESDSMWCWTSKSIMRRSILSFHRDRVNCSNSTSRKDGWALRQEKGSIPTGQKPPAAAREVR
jgi:hypothetical protein